MAAVYSDHTQVSTNGASHDPNAGSDLAVVFIHAGVNNPDSSRPSAYSGQQFDQGASEAITLPAGWDDQDPGDRMGGFGGYRVTGSDHSSGTCDYTIDTGGESDQDGAAVTLSGVDQSTPLDVSPIATHNGTSSASHTIDAEADQCGILFCHHRDGTTIPTPSGWTSILDATLTVGPVSTKLGVWYRDFTGSVTSVQITGMVSAEGISGVLLFNAAAGGGPVNSDNTWMMRGLGT